MLYSAARPETALGRRRCAMEWKTALGERMSRAVVSTNYHNANSHELIVNPFTVHSPHVYIYIYVHATYAKQ